MMRRVASIPLIGSWLIACGSLVSLPDGTAAQMLHPRDQGLLEQGATLGPAVESYGAWFASDPGEFVGPSDIYKVVVDVFEPSASPAEANMGFIRAARFLNMHVGSGVARENIDLVLVLHGDSTRDALSHEGYEKRFGVRNPNLPVIQQLLGAGARVLVCAQSATGLGMKEELDGTAELVLSAMTAFAKLGDEGYQRLSW